MGPRPDGRGKQPAAVEAEPRLAGVNGAAARRPRKERHPHLTVVAAAARQWGRGQTAAESSIRWAGNLGNGKRQWGRGQTAAERQANHADSREQVQASMGPRPDGRGKPYTNVDAVRRPRVNGAAARRPRKGLGVQLAHRSVSRQWSRGQTAAESSFHSKSPRLLISVNGAAARRPRKVGIVRRHFLVVVLRQWGRGQTAAESGGVPGAAAVAFASMGPRPDGRGKPLISASIRSVRGRQWGRGQTAAERPSTSPVPQPMTLRVNGAAARRPRKGGRRDPARARGRASMGPRPDGRGKRAAA